MAVLVEPEALCLVMVAAVCGLLLLGFPVAFTLAGASGAFALLGYGLGAFDLTFLTAMPQRIYATMSNEVLVAVPLFVFMGVMLERSKVAEELLDGMGRLFGGLPGGIAYSVTVVGMLLAASTGVVGATVVTMGLLSLPTMLARGYSASFASGSIAASGTLGQIIPPSIVLVLLGDQLSAAYQTAQYERGIFAPDTVSVNDLFAGALLPGLMLVGLYLLYQVAVATFAPHRAPAVPAADAGSRGIGAHLLVSLVAPLALIVAVLGSILAGLASPSEAAGVGILAVACMAGLLALTALFDLRMQRRTVSGVETAAFWLAVALSVGLAVGVLVAVSRVWGRIGDDGLRVLVSVMRSTMAISSMVFVILIGATMFSLVFRGFGGAAMVGEFLEALPGGTMGAVVLVMAVMFVLGFFLDFLEILFIVVPIVAPILLQMEVAPGVLMSPVWLGVMMGVNLQTSFLTPPFGLALFYLRGVAPVGVRTIDIYRGIAPFVLLQVLALAVIWSLPGLATWLPMALYGR
jgi:tripartite ATP-independent transporter DctM subunit